MLNSTLRAWGLLFMLVLLATAARAQRLAAGTAHSLAIYADNTLWAWGDNQSGELGDGSQTTQPRPVQVGTATWAVVAAGAAHSAGVRTDGSLWTWGDNSYNQLGNGNTTDAPAPIQVGAVGALWATVTCGNAHTVAIRQDGTLWAWGHNNYGQAGNGSSGLVNQRTPAQVGTANNWASVSAGTYHTLALRRDGTLWAWGDDSQRQIGATSIATQQNTPVQVGTDANWVSVSAGTYYSLAIKADGTLWAWGENGAGQLGSGNTMTNYFPTKVGTATNWASVAGGFQHTAGLRRDGTLWTWGYNSNGQLGNGTSGNTTQLLPTRVGTATTWAALAVGQSHNLARRTDNSIYAWGVNQRSQIGQGFPYSTTLTQVVDYYGVTSWSQAAAGYNTSFAISTTTLFGWGANGSGQLGNGSTSDYNTPIPVPLSAWRSKANGYAHSVGVKTDGSLWGWGDNQFGQAGINNYSYYETPIRVGSATNWQTVVAGYNHSAALRTDGTLWAWGQNTSGQLGNGTTTGTRAPQQVGTATNWTNVACGANHTVAVRQDGTLWAWGQNANGQVGTGSAGGLQQVPVQVGTATTWQSAAAGTSFTLAVRTDGSLWAWGDNAAGQLGDGTTTPHFTPARIGTATNWAYVAAGYGHVVALRTDGTLWTWGLNANGQLGNGTTTNRLTPLQVGTFTSWTDISAGSYHTLAARAAVQLWSAGLNDHGQLGQTPNIPVPTLVTTGGTALATVSATPVTWTLAPNPAHALVRLLGLPSGLVATHLYNAKGQLVRTGASAEVGLIGLTPGLYLLRAVAGGSTQTHRLVVE
jgi:alpha-tubulin suppressor-like RCC1 family protein